MSIQVGIVEDDALMRQMLTDKVSATMTVAFTAASLEEAHSKLAVIPPPQVILVDLNLPDGNGIELLRALSEKNSPTISMVISVLGDEQTVVDAIRAGAKGYLLKDDSVQQITSSITALVDGGSPISPSIARYLIDIFATPQSGMPNKADQLSPRELEVLQLASKGYSYPEVAALLNISANTVASHTKVIYDKLAVNSRTEALFEANRLGLMRDV